MLPESWLWLLSHAKTSFIPPPLTSDFFIKGNVTPWLSWQNCPISSSVPAAGVSDLRYESDLKRVRLTGILGSKLVAGETENLQSLGTVVLIQLLQSGELGCEAADDYQSRLGSTVFGAPSPLRSRVDDQDRLAFQLGLTGRQLSPQGRMEARPWRPPGGGLLFPTGWTHKIVHALAPWQRCLEVVERLRLDVLWDLLSRDRR